MSLRHFYSYVLAEKPDEITASSEVVTQLMEKVKRWSSSYKRSSLKENGRKWKDRTELVTPEKIQKFENSEASRDAVIIAGTVKWVTQHRDYSKSLHSSQRLSSRTNFN